MDVGLKDRAVLVTAASQGLGRACAEALAREGARVAICARRQDLLEDAARAVRAAGAADVLAVTADIDRPEDRDALFTGIDRHFGGLDAAVVNTGNPVGGWVDDVDDAAWEDAFRKWRAVVEIDRRAAHFMAPHGRGALVNILSRTAVQPSRSLALSSMVRAGLGAWTKMLADEMGPHGIRVLAVLPGLTRTAHIEEGLVAQGSGQKSGPGAERPGTAGSGTVLETAAKAAAEAEGVPLGRLGKPDALGRLVAFLASPACDYVTGSMVRFDGGAIRAL